LDAIPNIGRDWDSWKSIGAAIYHGLGPEGFPLFEKWSARSPFNDPDKTLKKWASYSSSPMTDVHVGTIFYKAGHEHGWTPPKKLTFLDRFPPAAADNNEEKSRGAVSASTKYPAQTGT
jgi:hypothetical protein